jgi:hypothetical protein
MTTLTYATTSIVMAVVYQLLLILLIVLRPDLPVYSTTISEWAIGKYGGLMVLAFIISALSYLFLSLSLKKEVNGRWGKTGIVLLFICFMGTLGVGLFITDPYPPDFTLPTTLIHTLAGTLAMVFLPFAALIICLNLANKNATWINHKRILKVLAFLPLVAFIGFNVHLNLYVIPLGADAVGEHIPIGYPPRIMFLTYHVWVVVVAAIFIKKEQNQIQ